MALRGVGAWIEFATERRSTAWTAFGALLLSVWIGLVDGSFSSVASSRSGVLFAAESNHSCPGGRHSQVLFL
jgi:hypothetical protein